MKKILFSMMMLCCAIMVNAQPKVTTHPFVAQGATAALGRLTATGSNISERGFCWATHRNPTIADEHSTKYYTNNGQIFELSPLEPATVYYVRAYAKNSAGEYGYGDVVKIVTKPMGNNRWSYDYAGDDATNERIVNAIKHSIDLYNNWTSIQGFHLNCHYVPGAGAGDGTADCSYGGWMRVSQNVSYQRTGTLLHESNHGVGVGTSNRWWSGDFRTNGDRGDWKGERATNMVRFFENNETATLHGDTQHMWPYGINGASEDHNSEIEYIANVLVTHALHEDGLCPIPDYGCSPAYSFAQEDTVKYYITNENEKFGNLQSFLYDAAGTLKYKEVGSTEELKENDQYAWYIEFVPSTCHYRLRNVKTNRYFSFSGSTIKALNRATAAATEEFTLISNREEATFGKGNKTFTKRSYNIMIGNRNYTPYTLNATANGSTNSTTLSFSSQSTTQRWFILTADEVAVAKGTTVAADLLRLQKILDAAIAMLNVPHQDKKDGATDAFQQVVEGISNGMAGLTSKNDVETAIESLMIAIKAYITNATPTEVTKPFDITCLINDPKFELLYDWTFNDQAVAEIACGVGSFNSEKFKFSQTLPTTPTGVYALKVNGYQCPGELSQVAEDWIAGKNNAKSYIYYYVTTNKTVVKNIFEDAPDAPLGDGEGSFENIGGKYLPVDAKADSLCFAAGLYDNVVIYEKKTANDAPFGIVNANTRPETQGKTAFANFRLYYYGTNVTKNDVINGIEEVVNSEYRTQGMFNLSGQKVSADYKGIVIRNGKKLLRR